MDCGGSTKIKCDLLEKSVHRRPVFRFRQAVLLSPRAFIVVDLRRDVFIEFPRPPFSGSASSGCLIFDALRHAIWYLIGKA